MLICRGPSRSNSRPQWLYNSRLFCTDSKAIKVCMDHYPDQCQEKIVTSSKRGTLDFKSEFAYKTRMPRNNPLSYYGCVRLASLGRPRCCVFYFFPGRTWAHNYPTFVLEKSPILFSSTNVCKCLPTLHLEKNRLIIT